MATYRIGIGSFNLKDGAVGLGTESSGLGNLKVEGTFKTTDLDTTSGIATFTRYAGFAVDNLEIGKDSRDVTLTGEHFTTGDIVVGVNSTFTVSVGATVDVGTVPSVSIGTHFSPPVGGVEDRPEVPVEGTVRFNTDLNTLEFYNGVDWRQFIVNGASGRCLKGGGSNTNTPHAKSIEYVNINTKGNGISFGDLLNPVDGVTVVSSSIRAVFLGGSANPTPPSGPGAVVDMNYVTIASEGNAIDFGDLQQVCRYPSSATNGTRGLCMNGQEPGYTTMINAINISTLGNAVDTGGEYTGSSSLAECVYSPVRMIIVSGYSPSSPNVNNTIHYINISSTGDTTEFGHINERSGSAFSNNVRGIIGGGWTGSATEGMKYMSIASLGEFQEFGDMTLNRNSAGNGNAASQTRGLFMGGSLSPVFYNIVDYVNIQTLGDAIDFGDMTGSDIGGNSPIAVSATISDSHGGLGGY